MLFNSLEFLVFLPVALALFAASLAVVAGLARIPGLKTHAM